MDKAALEKPIKTPGIMILSLRKRHRMIWLLLAILLPIGVVVAWLAKPDADLAIGTYPFETALSGSPVGETVAFSHGTIQLVAQPATRLQTLVFQIEKPLDQPGVAVYVSDQPLKDPKKGTSLGILGSKGPTYFKLDTSTVNWSQMHALLFDPIRKQTLQTIQLY
jgi:hypothetical protein